MHLYLSQKASWGAGEGGAGDDLGFVFNVAPVKQNKG